MPPPLDWIAAPGRALAGTLDVPGDKSVSHRALLLAAIAEGRSRITGFLEGEDTRATAAILGQLGVRIEAPAPGERLVHGVGLHGLRAAASPLDCGNAGTGMRLLAGLLAGQSFASTLVGDASLSRRPMRRVLDPLRRMGARIDAVDDQFAPLRINTNNVLHAIEFTADVPSAQVKSAVLLAGLYAAGETRVVEPQPTRDYTERMLRAFGWPVDFAPGRAALSGGHVLRATDVAVPADFSSAAFPLVAALLVPGSRLRLRRVGINPRRTGLLQALRLMGAKVAVEPAGALGADAGSVGDAPGDQGEPVADLVAAHAPLRGIDLSPALVPDMIDELPVFFVAAALATGTTTIRGAAELRVKESDRIATMAAALRAMGADITETPDGAVIRGGRLHGADVDSHGDHRVAMALAVAAQCASGPVRIGDCGNVATSFPGFLALAVAAGFGLRAAPATDPVD